MRICPDAVRICGTEPRSEGEISEWNEWRSKFGCRTERTGLGACKIGISASLKEGTSGDVGKDVFKVFLVGMCTLGGPLREKLKVDRYASGSIAGMTTVSALFGIRTRGVS